MHARQTRNLFRFLLKMAPFFGFFVMPVLMTAPVTWAQYQGPRPAQPAPALIEGVWALPKGGPGQDVVIQVSRRPDGFFEGLIIDRGMATKYKPRHKLFVVRDTHKPDTFVGTEYSYNEVGPTKTSLTLVVTGQTLSYRAGKDVDTLQRRTQQVVLPSRDEQLRKLNQEYNNTSRNHALCERLFNQAQTYARQAEAAGNISKANYWDGKAQELSSRMRKFREKMRQLEGQINSLRDGSIPAGPGPGPVPGPLMGVNPGGPVVVPGR